MAPDGQADGFGLPRERAERIVDDARVAMVITNPDLDDNPIVYVNAAFTAMTGYAREAAVGRNCRFLQGADSEPEVVQQIRDAVAAEETCNVELTNYRADGTPFRNRLLITPVDDDDGRVALFLGVQTDLGRKGEGALLDEALRELQHRVKNHLSMIVGFVRMEARGSATPIEFETVSRRVEALQMLYEELTLVHGGNEDRIQAGSYLSRLCTSLAEFDGRPGIQLGLDLDEVYVDVDRATRLGLILSEMLTNALQHAFVGRDHGTVDVRLREMAGGALRLTVEDDGIGLPDGVDWPDPSSTGGRVVRALVGGVGGTLDVVRGANGTIINLDVPAAGTGTDKD